MFYVFDEKLQKIIKTVPYNREDIISPVVLAHLIRGDGNIKPNDKIIRIYTNSFSKQDVERLAKAITNKLGIVTKALYERNYQYILTISRNQLETVRSLVLPYMHVIMLYKLGLDLKQYNGSHFKVENHLDEI